jgi:hypothetical protein
MQNLTKFTHSEKIIFIQKWLTKNMWSIGATRYVFLIKNCKRFHSKILSYEKMKKDSQSFCKLVLLAPIYIFAPNSKRGYTFLCVHCHSLCNDEFWWNLVWRQGIFFVYAFFSSMHSCFFLFLQILWTHMSCPFLLLLQILWVILSTFHQLLAIGLVWVYWCAMCIMFVKSNATQQNSVQWTMVGFVIFNHEFLLLLQVLWEVQFSSLIL